MGRDDIADRRRRRPGDDLATRRVHIELETPGRKSRNIRKKNINAEVAVPALVAGLEVAAEVAVRLLGELSEQLVVDPGVAHIVHERPHQQSKLVDGRQLAPQSDVMNRSAKKITKK